jgi:hypothetical protein
MYLIFVADKGIEAYSMQNSFKLIIIKSIR